MERALFRALAVAAGLLVSAAAAAPLAEQKSSAAGVTVRVTPQAVAADAKTWNFNVSMDTHSQELSDDLAQTTMLIDDRGTQYRPLAWEGAGPGGHHRSGVLKFPAGAQSAGSLELRMRRPGEAKPRAFRWTLR